MKGTPTHTPHGLYTRSRTHPPQQKSKRRDIARPHFCQGDAADIQSRGRDPSDGTVQRPKRQRASRTLTSPVEPSREDRAAKSLAEVAAGRKVDVELAGVLSIQL
jgi:hypothetical protein